jgi:hypothetical protein
VRPPHLPDHRLGPADVPSPAASWQEVVDFGHRYHAYKVAGSLQRVAQVTLDAHDRFTAAGEVPDGLPRLRLALFHTVRATHGEQPSAETERWARALVEAIRDRVREADGDR